MVLLCVSLLVGGLVGGDVGDEGDFDVSVGVGRRLPETDGGGCPSEHSCGLVHPELIMWK